MKRKGTLEFLGILLMIAFFINFFSMFLQPSVVYQSLQFATDDLDPRIEAGGLAHFLEDGYVTQGVNYSLYQTSYDSARSGADLDYHVNNVPSQEDVTASLVDDAQTAITTAYLTGRESSEDCGLPGEAENFPEVDISVINHSQYQKDALGVLFETDVSGGPMSIQCETDVTMSHFDIAVQHEIFSIHNRYFKAYNRTRDILRNESLNQYLDDVHRNASTTMVIESCTTTDGGFCGTNVPNNPYGDTLEEDDYAVRKWEGEVGEEVSTHLEEVTDYYNGIFNQTNFTVDITLDGVDYRPYDVSMETDLKYVSDHQDAYDSGQTGCDGCDWECGIENPSSGTSYSSYCVDDWSTHTAGGEPMDNDWDISMSTTQGTVEDDANPWVVSEDQPWTQTSSTGETGGSCSYTVDDPYPDYNINWGTVSTAWGAERDNTTDIARMGAITEEDEERSLSQALSCTSPTVCGGIFGVEEDECECSESSCSRDLGSEIKRRTLYNYSLQTAVQIKVEVTDNRTDFLVDGESSGEEPLTFVTHYTYRSWDDHHDTIANWGSASEVEYEPKTDQFTN